MVKAAMNETTAEALNRATELKVQSEAILIRSNEEVKLAGQVFVTKAGKFSHTDTNNDPFYGLVGWTECKRMTEAWPIPNTVDVYELWPLDPNKLRRLFKNTIGMCKHTSAAYDAFVKSFEQDDVDNRKWEELCPETREAHLEGTRSGNSVYGSCPSCQHDYGLNTKLTNDANSEITKMFHHYMNNHLFVESSVKMKKDMVDGFTVTEEMQRNYFTYRQLHELASCVVGDDREAQEKVRSCKIVGDPKAVKEEFLYDAERMKKIRQAIFRPVKLFSTDDEKLKNLTLSAVKPSKVNKGLAQRSDAIYSFDAEYVTRHQYSSGRSMVKRKNFAQVKDPVFSLGAATASDANVWRNSIQTALSPQKIKKNQFKAECQDAIRALESSPTGRYEWQSMMPGGTGKCVQLYPDREPALTKWAIAQTRNPFEINVREFRCVSHEDFHCDVLDSFHTMVQRRFYQKGLGEESIAVDYGCRTGLTMNEKRRIRPVFEVEAFGSNLITMKIEYNPADIDDGESKYGMVNHTALVHGRIRTKYQVGYPEFPYYLPKMNSEFFESTALAMCNSIQAALNKQPYWNRWFTMKKGYWTDCVYDKNTNMKSFNVFWRSVVHEEFNKRRDVEVIQEKTYIKGARDVSLDMLYIKVEDTGNHTQLRRDLFKAVTKSNWMNWDAEHSEMFRIKQARMYANIGVNAKDYLFRQQVVTELFKFLQFSVARRHLQLFKWSVTLIYHFVSQVTLEPRVGSVGAVFVANTTNALWEMTVTQPIGSGTRVYIENAFFHISTLLIPLLLEKAKVSLSLLDTEGQSQLRNSIEKLVRVGTGREMSDAAGMHRSYFEFEKLNEHRDVHERFGDEHKTFKQVLKTRRAEQRQSKESESLEKMSSNFNQYIVERATKLCEVLQQTVGEAELMDFMDRLGFLASRIRDQTCRVSLYANIDEDKWTGLPGLLLEDDVATMDFLRRSIACLETQNSSPV